jgi:hypothetical protein
VWARRRAATGGATSLSDGGVRGSRLDRRRLEGGGFLISFPLSSGTTGLAHEQGLGRPVPTSSG